MPRGGQLPNARLPTIILNTADRRRPAVQPTAQGRQQDQKTALGAKSWPLTSATTTRLNAPVHNASVHIVRILQGLLACDTPWICDAGVEQVMSGATPRRVVVHRRAQPTPRLSDRS